MKAEKKNPALPKRAKSKQKTLFLSPHCHWAMDVIFRAYGSHSTSGVVEAAIMRFLRTDPEVLAYMKRHNLSEPALVEPPAPIPEIA